MTRLLLLVVALFAAATVAQQSAPLQAPRNLADLTVLVQHEGNPVSGAQVRFLPADPQQTDANGSVTTHRSLQPGPSDQTRVPMVVRADGFATTFRYVTFGPGTTTQVIDLTRETLMTGRVVGPAGKPLAQATLRAIFVPGQVKPASALIPDDFLLPLHLDPAGATARTDEAGMFTLRGLRAAQSYRLLVDADEPSIASSERLVTAGDGPIEVALKSAVPVTLAISGLRGMWGPGDRQSDGMKALNKMIMERALKEQPELVRVVRVSRGPGLTILMEWLDPDTGQWMPVLSPRQVKVRSATRADLRFDKVPVGTIRVSTTGDLQLAAETFDPVKIRTGRRIRIPVQVTALQQVEVKVTNRDGLPASGLPVEFSRESDGLSWLGNTGAEGSFTVMASPTEDLKVNIMVADKVVASTTIRPDASRPRSLAVHIRIAKQ